MTTDPLEFSSAEVPQIHDNAPGKGTIAYRYGTHATILQRLLSRLHQQEIPGAENATPTRPLQALSIHDRADPAIMLLDAWAMVADVVSFYQERIANEGYLRTAIEDRSILELSKTIGYEVRPGVAASTPLVFTVEDAPGSEPIVLVPQGTQVQSIPTQPGEVPQTFETVAAFEARVEWNVLTPYLKQELEQSALEAGTTQLKLQGTNTLLQPGDTILIVGDERLKDPRSDRWYLRTLKTVEPEFQEDFTKITWSDGGLSALPTKPQVFAFRQRAFLFGYNAPQSSYLMMQGEGTISIQANSKIINGNNTFFVTRSQLKENDIIRVENQVRMVVAVGGDAQLTVHAPFASPLVGDHGFHIIRSDNIEPNPRLHAGDQINLDAVYPKILPQSWLILNQQGRLKLYQAQSTSTIFNSDFGLVSQITTVKVDLPLGPDDFDVRKTSILLQSEKLEIFHKSALKRPSQVTDLPNTIALNQVASHLHPGQSVIISGRKNSTIENNAITKTVTNSVVTVESMSNEVITDENKNIVDQYTKLVIKEDFEVDSYELETLKIYANVVLSTHGETIADEVLGSGDGTQANQQFILKRSPLTYISTTTATGIQSTLKVYVNQVLWQQVQSLHNQNARSQCYIVQTDEQGQTRIIFGDGIRGARLPSGQENVRATYRAGIGRAGEVKAGSLILLQNRPLGIRDVTNPLAAGGAADRDSFDIVRKNAPRTVLTLNHVVSLRDFENFARSFAGIGKAQASLIWTGEMRQIYITVADENGKAASLELRKTLQDAIAAAGNTLQPIQVASYDPKEGLFNLKAKVLVSDRYRFETVKPQIKQALSHVFSFHQREFGQGVAASEIIQIIQGVEGVVAVDLDALYLSLPELSNPTTQADQPKLLESFLEAKSARLEGKAAKPAQILLLNTTEPGVVLEEWI